MTAQCRSTTRRRAAWGDLPATLERMIAATIDEMYSLGEEPLPRGDVRQRRQGGAVLQGLLVGGDDRVGGAAGQEAGAKRYIQTSEKGIKVDDLLNAVREEFKENEDLPNTTNPDDWAKIAGKKGERIVYVKPLMGEVKDKQRAVERVINTGQYL